MHLILRRQRNIVISERISSDSSLTASVSILIVRLPYSIKSVISKSEVLRSVIVVVAII